MNSEMNYCNKCGVELDVNMNFCPLCGLSTGENPDGAESSESAQSIDNAVNNYESLTRVQRQKLFWELSCIILVSVILVTLIINLLLDKSITWSRYSIAGCLTLLANISILTFWRHKKTLLIWGSFISTAVFLVLLDLFSTNIGWGINLGIPILISFYVLLLLVIWLIRISKQRGFNILAIVFVAIGLFSVCIEGFISLYFANHFHFRWSIIVAISILPISALLFFVHYRLKKGVDLKRFFHI
ncbi:MAG: DUF6320 domain-containing protein [Labilibaculum antarcticum]